MALRAVRGLKPKERAIWYAFSPLWLARSIWQRRKVKASGERNPASRVSRSASLKGRTKMGRFIPQRINLDYHLVWRCTRPTGRGSGNERPGRLRSWRHRGVLGGRVPLPAVRRPRIRKCQRGGVGYNRASRMAGRGRRDEDQDRGGSQALHFGGGPADGRVVLQGRGLPAGFRGLQGALSLAALHARVLRRAAPRDLVEVGPDHPRLSGHLQYRGGKATTPAPSSDGLRARAQRPDLELARDNRLR